MSLPSLATNGHLNGNSHSDSGRSIHSYDGAESLPSTSAHPNGHSEHDPPYPNHNEDIVNHLYHIGFQTGNYADTVLHVYQKPYRLHAIILSRSPFLARLMSTSPQGNGQRTIYLNVEQDPEITEEGLAIALGYLYSSISLPLIRPENARAVLAAGCLLGGMTELCHKAYETCRRSISVESIGSWLEFIDLPSAGEDGTPAEAPPTTAFGTYVQRLRDDVFHFLVVTLPGVLDMHGSQEDIASGASGRDVLLQVFSLVPFEMFKAAIESPAFQIGARRRAFFVPSDDQQTFLLAFDATGSDRTRFTFAKDAIELRKRGIARGTGSEETVVLAFGGNNFGGSAVHVTRKMRKRPLWKVNS